MRKLISIAVIVMMSAMALPGTSAEIVEEEYTGACCAREGVSGENIGLGLVVFPNREDSWWTQAGIRPIGGVRLNADDAYTNLVITVNDGVYGADTAVQTCFWNPDGNSSCGDDDYASGAQCGGPALLGSPFASASATTFVYLVYVAPDLTTCGGTTGSVVANFF